MKHAIILRSSIFIAYANERGIRMLRIIFSMQLKELIKEKRILMMAAIAGLIMIYLPYKVFLRIGDTDVFHRTAVDFYLIFYSLITVLILTYAGNYSVFLREKADKTLHCLLSTPLNIRVIWLGKTLALLALGYSLSLLSSFIFVLIANKLLRIDTIIAPSPYGYVSIFIFNPVICFSIIGILGIMTFLSRDELKIRYGSLLFIFALLYFLRPDAISIDLSLIRFHILISAFLIGLTLIGLKFLKNERVVLSTDR